MSDAHVAVQALSRAADAIRQISESCERDRELGRLEQCSARHAGASHLPHAGEIQREIVDILCIEADFGRLVGRLVDLVDRVREGAVLETRREMGDYMEACARQLRAYST